MSLHSRWVRGNLAYYQTHKKRIIHAVGQDVIEFDLKPGLLQANGGSGGDPNGFTVTPVEVGSGTSEITASNTSGYVAEIVTAANENDGLNVQLNGELFELTSDQDVYFGVEFESNDATQIDIFGGSVRC